jgi:poly(hydroxyalkanoate) depolymerase family esterase
MRNLNDTLTRLAALRARSSGPAPKNAPDRLVELHDFGNNPGALRARFHVPQGLAAGSALVVILHGCTQDAAGYDRGSGWSQLADERGFAVLFPEQQRANNANLCFNWFNAEDVRRGSGEALSIRQMVAALVAQHGLDPARVYVTGLSAGGAMTSAMLATYPDVFAGGAVIAGLPFGTARSVPEAFDRMRAHGGPAAAGLGALVRSASDHRGDWPSVSVWHGDSDATVSPANAGLIVEQWRTLHGAAEQPDQVERVDGHERRVWRDASGRAVIEEYRIRGLGHGTPLSTTGEDACGAAAPYMLEAGISSTRRIADFWGLKAQANAQRAPAPRPAAATERAAPPPLDRPRAEHHGVTKVIEDALRAAGLMR